MTAGLTPDMHFKRWLAVQSVHTFDDLCELMVLEHFRDTLPGELATYITELKFSVVLAVPADVAASSEQVCPGRLALRGVVGRGALDPSHRCNYCHELAHWKSECPVLMVRSRHRKAYVKPAAAVAPVAPVAVSECEVPSAD